MSLFTKKEKPTIDPEQRELYENARRRVKQKKRLYQHFVLFLAGAIVLIVINLVLNIGSSVTILGQDWFVWAILLWSFFFLVHLINVIFLGKFMGKEWENEQIAKLVAKQNNRLAELKEEVTTDHPLSTATPKESLPKKKGLNDPNTPL